MNKSDSLVLIVDDEQMMRETLAEILEASGFKSFQAESGSDALKKIGQQMPKLVISDLLMDKGSGIDLLRSLKKLKIKIPFILMTGRREMTEASLTEDGVDQILYKPFKPQELLSAVQHHLLK